MTNDKELAKGCFDHYLKDCLGLHASWTTGEGPPDYYLEVGPHGLGVQVGVLEGRPDTEGRALGEVQHECLGGIRAEQELAARIESAAGERGMRGDYGISFLMILSALNDASIEQVVEQALQFVGDTQEWAAPLPGAIRVLNVLVARIEKSAHYPDSIQVARRPSLDWSHWGERVREARTAVQGAFSTARRPLRDSRRAKTSPGVVLLLLDRWLHGREGIYGFCMRGSALRECWQSIFVVEEPHTGYFPLDEHKDWWMRLAGISEFP